MQIDRREIGRRLKSALIAAKITQTELSKELGISQPSVSAYIQGSSAPSPEALATISKLCGVSIDWLIIGEGGPSGVDPGNWVEHSDRKTERAAEELRAEIALGGKPLSRSEEQVVKMYRYLEEHHSELAKQAYEDMVEAFLDAHSSPGRAES